MNKAVKEATDILNKEIEETLKNGDFRAYLDMQAKFHKYSFANTILILMQKPDASRVAGVYNWNKLGRRIKQGEHGIRILAPCVKKDEDENERVYYYKAVYVFDVSQTEGEELPEICHELQGDIEEYEKLFAGLKEISPCPIAITEITDGAKGRYIPFDDKIEINADMSEKQTIKTTVHEIAHAMLHRNSDKDSRTKEIEAESVAYIVCKYFGIDTGDYSFEYIAVWGKDIAEVKKSMACIQKCAGNIIEKLNSY